MAFISLLPETCKGNYTCNYQKMYHYVKEDEVLESFKIPLMDLITKNVILSIFFRLPPVSEIILGGSLKLVSPVTQGLVTWTVQAAFHMFRSSSTKTYTLPAW